MNRVRLLTFLVFLFSIPPAGAVTVEEAFEQWKDFLGEHMWVIRKYEPDLYLEILDGVRQDLEKRVSKNQLLFNAREKQELLLGKYIVVSPLLVLDM